MISELSNSINLDSETRQRAPDGDTENAASPESASPSVTQAVPENGNAWTTVNNRRRRQRGVTGSKVSSGSLRGVQQVRDFYIGRCDNSVTDEILKEYVSSEIDINVLACRCISREDAPVKSFKLTVSEADSSKVLDEEVWPQGVRVRKFFIKQRRNGSSD